jgi:hypothetical protein
MHDGVKSPKPTQGVREKLLAPLVVYKSQRRAGPRPVGSRVQETWVRERGWGMRNRVRWVI